MPLRAHRIGRDAPCPERAVPTASSEVGLSADLAHAEPFPFSPDAAGVPRLPEAEPFAEALTGEAV